MGKMSREKGKRFEREVAGLFKDEGYDARRSAQYCGSTGEAADVIGAPGIHIECKHAEQMRLYEWMDQAVRDTEAGGKPELPVVIHKKNSEPVLCTMLWCDWIRLYRAWEARQ